jgi:transposase-like protein
MNPILSAPHFHNEEAAFAYVEAHLWPEGPTCPHCGNADPKRIYALRGKTTRMGLRKCAECRKPFTVRIGTVFEDSHCPLHIWLQAIHLICSSKKGISTRQLQRTMGGSMKTAWFLGHRIREMMDPKRDLSSPPMGGATRFVEADETFIGRKAGTKVGYGHRHMNAVFSLVERRGPARSFHVPNVRADTLRPVILRNVAKESALRTDESNIYYSMAWHFASHLRVNHAKNEYVRGSIHTNTIEGFFSILKRGIYGVYQHVSEAHLQRYLHEFDFRYTYRSALDIEDVQRASIALTGAKGKRLTYRTTRRSRSEAQAV